MPETKKKTAKKTKKSTLEMDKADVVEEHERITKMLKNAADTFNKEYKKQSKELASYRKRKK